MTRQVLRHHPERREIRDHRLPDRGVDPSPVPQNEQRAGAAEVANMNAPAIALDDSIDIRSCRHRGREDLENDSVRGSLLHGAPEPPGRAVREVDDQPHFVGRCRLDMHVADDLRQRRHPREGLVHRYFVKPLMAVVLLELAPVGDRRPRGDRQHPSPHPRGLLPRWRGRKDVQDLLRQRHAIILEHDATSMVDRRTIQTARAPSNAAATAAMVANSALPSRWLRSPETRSPAAPSRASRNATPRDA